ncbi:Rft-1-domain-containing protein [Hesseltinella vesiculosa]|uniref:Man(5)GlcNAc(2)-PP-dolichol translocation protein RFT1 n=1 Tax=Hesseltinella vesiculosa TaxID=101127 RepID=A0A1X2GMH6_9FUNG|nr:Rft-1-domain-containing protein [Hesseltinella vesiculosa]
MAKPKKPSDDDTNQQLLASTAKGASYLILLQLGSRMLTFVLHQIVLRYTSAETFGIASVKLELLLSTILFLSREGYRCALVRGEGVQKPSRDSFQIVPEDSAAGQEQKITNISYIPTVLGLLCTCLACQFYLFNIDDTTADLYPHYRLSVILFGLAAMIELSIEPFFIKALNSMYFQLRVSIEGVAVVLRCLVTFALTLYGAKLATSQYSLLAFALAQFVYGVVLAVGYVGFFLLKVWRQDISLTSLFPRKLVSTSGTSFWLDESLTALGSTLTKQSLLKHVLTEGDKMLISALSTDRDQGIYAFVVNYGSLVARILFQPLEETGRTLFSKLLNKKESRTNERALALDVLLLILRCHVVLGLVFICFATNYTSTLIDLLVGKKWSMTQAPSVLALYCMYVPIMGINGITEGFVQAVASKQDLARLSYYMVGFSLVFMSAGALFMHVLPLGAFGLVLANMVNLGVRIGYSWYYIVCYFHEEKRALSIWSWWPSWATTMAFAFGWASTFWSKQVIGWDSLTAKMQHIGVGGFCFVCVCFVIYWKDRSLLVELRQLFRKQKME